jgi:hypothetical protein
MWVLRRRSWTHQVAALSTMPVHSITSCVMALMYLARSAQLRCGKAADRQCTYAALFELEGRLLHDCVVQASGPQARAGQRMCTVDPQLSHSALHDCVVQGVVQWRLLQRGAVQLVESEHKGGGMPAEHLSCLLICIVAI